MMDAKNIFLIILTPLIMVSCSLFKLSKGDVNNANENGLYIGGEQIKDLSYASFFDCKLSKSYSFSTILFYAEKISFNSSVLSKDKIADANWSVICHDGNNIYVLKIFRNPWNANITVMFDSDGKFISEKSNVKSASFNKGRYEGGVSMKICLTLDEESTIVFKYDGPVDGMELL